MGKKKETYCKYNTNGVLCDTPNTCRRCGWNPRVEEQRITRLRVHGKDALVKKKPPKAEKTETLKATSSKKHVDHEAVGRYILQHEKTFGGDMSAKEIQKALGIGGSTYAIIKKAAVVKLARISLGLEDGKEKENAEM